MPPPLEAEDIEEPEFKWGKKRGRGGKKMDVRFYESFTYDGEEYALYDYVFMHKDGEPSPYIGKIVKIWENADKSKKIKVHWLFRPCEISHYLKDTEVLENELFFASGNGKGLSNINPLEAIAGKCHVVCTSMDNRNPQPSVEELRMADYVFYRFFDVGSLTISDQMDDTVGGLEVKFVFNRKESGRTPDTTKLDSGGPNEERNAIACKGTLKIAGNNSSQQLDNVKLDDKETNSIKSSTVHEKDTVMIGPISSNAMPTSPGKDLKLDENSSLLDEKVSKISETPISQCNKDIDVAILTTQLVNNSSALTKRTEKTSDYMEGGLSKKAKFDDSVKVRNGNEKNANELEKTSVAHAKHASKLVISYDDKAKSKIGKVALKENHIETVGKLSNSNLSKLASGTSPSRGGGVMVERRTFEVTPRPIIEKNNWIKLTWEERLKGANDKGNLVLIQNLDAQYTSKNVEDIIWHAFKEECTAKMVQHTAISNPHSGQAFAIFKTREAADRVVKRLDNGCLLLPNGRPLVASRAFPKYFEKGTAFVGHLDIDKDRRQIQRESKEAVSTSHYSQSNTIEYEMAMDWCLLQSKSDMWWEKLYEGQRKELKKLEDTFKSK